MDAQGWPRARPFVEKAGLTFPAVVDRKGVLWRRFDFDVVPLQLFFDETGRLVYTSRGAPEGPVLERLDAELAKAVRTVPDASLTARAAAGGAEDAFSLGVAAFDAGRVREAREHWLRALREDPDNWLIRKQIWALEAPDRFYDGEIDVDWQRERVRREREAQR